MAAAKKGRRSSGSQGYPGRALAVILIALVALTGGMFLAHQTTPRLGIDLAGGVSITLEAKSDQANAVNKTNMNIAKDIISQRVNGMGVSEAETQIQGSRDIIVNIPKGVNADEAEKQVGTTALLYFRQVLAVDQGVPAPATPTPTPSASGSAKPAPSGSATPKAGSTATPTTTPSSTASKQGRAVTDALKGTDKAPTPQPTATPSAPAAGTAPSTGTAPTTTDTSVPAALQAAFAKLDCSDSKQAEAVGANTKPGDKVLACENPGKKDSIKYVLGPTLIEGKNVNSANAAFDNQQGDGWVVNLGFNSKGASQFTKVTGDLAKAAQPNNQFAIDLDGTVVSAPSVSYALTGGSAKISGSFTQSSAEDLANTLKYGSLPLSFDTLDKTTVSASLGGEQLRGGMIAGAVGLALVVIYLLAYYRGLSFVAVLSLAVSAGLTYTIMCLLGTAIGFALNLPAVCGAIVAIGITADSFIVFFERIRDELREGRSLQPAVARGWPRARRTILVSDFVSFLAAAVLYIVTVGKVQGFAFTLGLTTLLDVAVVFLFTKPLMTILARKPFYAKGHKWSGLNPESLGTKGPLRSIRRPISNETKEA